MRKILWLVCILSLLAVPAHAEFSALERGSTAGRIIYSVSDGAYLTKSGQAITEETISGLSSGDYGKTGLVADGNSRLILRYKSSQPGNVTFTVSPSIAGSRLELFADRSEITAAVSTVSTDNGYQVSAVFVAPETWPEAITYPRGSFTVTATFTPSNGGTASTETLNLTLQAPPVVLIHGMYSNAEDAFGYNTAAKSGVWHTLKNAGLTVTGWNYDNKKAPKTVIANNSNGLAKIIADTLDTLNAAGIAATRVDLVTHSTGGLMARQYLRNDIDTGNKTANSYGEGTVRRVVTIASPNLGTPIASYLAGKFETLPATWQSWAAKSWWEGLGYSLLKAFALKDAEVDDFALKSSYIAGLGYPGIPFHSIYGKVKSDDAKLNQLFDDVASGNTVNLSKIDWLPRQFVELLTSSKGEMIGGVIRAISDDVRLKELFGALFESDDHDLIVSETSAKDNFPSNAVTSFTGLGNHNHLLLACQNDVAARVLALLRGDASGFMINTASASEYDRVFDSYMMSDDIDIPEEYLDDFMRFIEELLVIGLELENNPASKDEILAYHLNAPAAANSRVYVMITDDHGGAVCLPFRTSDDKFNTQIMADPEHEGIYQVSYFAVVSGELKMSAPQTMVFSPKLEGVTDISFARGTIYCHVGDEVFMGLSATTASGNYDISSPSFDIAAFTVSDSAVVEITSTGKVKALKEGTATITASAYGKTASANVIVGSSSAEADTTIDIEVTGETSTGDTDSGVRSSSGGCNAGLGGLILLSAVAFFRKKR